jgi:hypothetical protein
MSATRLEFHHKEEIKHAEVGAILRALANLRYGSVEIVVHDGRITQIERREKVRLSNDLKMDHSSKD